MKVCSRQRCGEKSDQGRWKRRYKTGKTSVERVKGEDSMKRKCGWMKECTEDKMEKMIREDGVDMGGRRRVQREIRVKTGYGKGSGGDEGM